MIKIRKFMKKLAKKRLRICFFGLAILALPFLYLVDVPSYLAQETNLESAASHSTNYQLDPSVVNPAGGLSNSANYQLISTFGSVGSGTYESSNYLLKLGFPAIIFGKKFIKPPEGTEKPPVEVIEIPEATTTVAEDISNAINQQIDKIIEALPAPIKKTVVRTVQAVNNTVRAMRSNKQVTSIVDDVIQPTVITTAVLGVLALATTSSTALELTNIAYLFFRFGYFWLLPLSFSKKRKPWGVVFDSTTGRPIKGAIVRIFSREFDKLRESLVTDTGGRFGFLIDIGDYYVVAQKPGFVFPSKLITTAVISQYHNIYRGETIKVKERREGILNINIPVDPESGQVSKRRLLWLRILNYIGVFLEKINVPLLIAGTIISWAILVFEPKLLNYTILFVYLILLLLKVFLFRGIRRSWGEVLDEKTNKPIEQALVRVFNLSLGVLAATRVTNKDGQFTSLISPGEYYLVVSKPGYSTYQTKPIKVLKERAILRMTIKLIKEAAVSTFTPPATKPSAAK